MFLYVRTAIISRWASFWEHVEPSICGQESRILLEAHEAYSNINTEAYVVGAKQFVPDKTSSSSDLQCVYEFRNYQLLLGYNPVPKLIQAFKKGLPAKIIADRQNGGGQLAFIGYTDYGVLNQGNFKNKNEKTKQTSKTSHISANFMHPLLAFCLVLEVWRYPSRQHCVTVIHY